MFSRHLFSATRTSFSPLSVQRAMITTTAAEMNLTSLGFENKGKVFRNLSYPEIYEHEINNNEGVTTANGTFAVDTGKFTGRSPKDKWIVKQSPSEDDLWWGSVNQPTTEAVFDELYDAVKGHYNESGDIYVFDGYCGANPATRKRVRFVTEMAWQHHFVTNMFIRPTAEELVDFEPDFTIINSCKISNPNWERHGLNSEVFVTFNVEKSMAIIGGTFYGGEMKKGIFSMMNYWLPKAGVMAMHCSANMGKDGDTALFFGLSGTGKTTLSADPHRYLIGDDEHGWDDDGIFNFEGGCYAKTINLSAEAEPEIYGAIRRDALLENVYLDEKTNEPDYFNSSKTENSRVSYPLFHIPNFKEDGMGGHPSNVVFLTCDAYGVLPPVSKLSSEQAMYHFLSGYTAKVAGTERGITEPQATFSACFGAAFLTLHPTRYADLLKEKLDHHETNVFLVNTGWTGGPYGTGKRMSIHDTRACIDAVLDGSINNAEFTPHPVFQVGIPSTIPGVNPNVINPRDTWADKDAYDATAQKLANMFKKNFSKYVEEGKTDYTSFGPI